MYKISDLQGKKLIDVSTAKDLGEICGIAFSKCEGSCALVTSEGQFAAEKIFSVKDAVSVVNPQPVSEFTELKFGKIAYDTTGKHLGKLAEVEFGNALTVVRAHLDDGTVASRGKIYAVGDVLLIRTRTPIVKRTAAKDEQAGEKPQHTGKKLTTAQWLQNRRYGDFSFLIGKVVDKNITNFQGELMIKQGERVSNTVLRQAKVSGKLIELCLHTK